MKEERKLIRINETTQYNQTYEKIVCYRSLIYRNYINPIWQQAHMILYSAIPFFIMLLCNSIIIYNIRFGRAVQSKTKGSVTKKRRMTLMLILVTFVFILLTAPSVILHAFFKDFFKNKPFKRLAYMIVSNLLHTSHAINFFLYVYSSPTFRSAFVALLFNIKRKIYIRKENTRIDRNKKTFKKSQPKASNSENGLEKLNKSEQPDLD